MFTHRLWKQLNLDAIVACLGITLDIYSRDSIEKDNNAFHLPTMNSESLTLGEDLLTDHGWRLSRGSREQVTIYNGNCTRDMLAYDLVKVFVS